MGKRTAVVAILAGVACLGAIASTAIAGKKKGTKVVINAGPVLSGQQNVKVSGSLNTTTACRGARSMRLFLTDEAGTVLATIDSGSTGGGGNWTLKAKLASPPTAEQRLQVKAKKLAVGKFVCKAGLSGLIAID